ncbi:hypothetical protein QAD02_006279 [Eretmocerus hayati]|uniref:Uncharacterized protein n=1 Tax=Eretmocerus hayati TaxID=131215 RepID=A0ACC2N2R7_9HYME|nr:hypothetical protein QAD02_006279 [Eretmocerus hayati]
MCCDKKRHFHICLRALIIGIREAGSIENLRNELTKVDKISDPCFRGFRDNGVFKSNTFKSLYTLKSGGTSKTLLEPMALSAFLILISLAKNTQIFGEDFDLKQVRDLIENEDTLFVGSLLVKLREMKRMNAHSYTYYNNECGKLADPFECQKILCCATGTCIAPLTSTINHSCFPNVAKCFTVDQKIIVYAVRPIKKNYQLFDNYYSAFYDMPKVSRQKRMKAYDFICDCVACSDDWPPMLRVTSEMKKLYGSIPMEKMESNFYKDCEKIFLSLACAKENFDQKTLDKLCKTMSKVMKQLRQPCYTTCLLMSAIPQVFSSIYGLRPQSFGDCI